MASNLNSVDQAVRLLAELGVDVLPGPSAARPAASVQSDPGDRLAEYLLRQALAESPVQRVLHGHDDWVTSAVYGSEEVILTAGNDGRAIFWNPETGEERQRLELGAPARFYSGRPQFSADGRRVLIATVDGRIHVGEWEGESKLTVLSASGGRQITRAALSRAGDVVVAGLDDNTALLWVDVSGESLALGDPVRNDPQLFVSAVAISADGQHVAVASSNGLVMIWPVEASPGTPRVLLGANDYVNTVVFARNDELLAAASDDYHGLIWRWRHTSTPTVLAGHEAEVNDIAVSRNGRRVVTAGSDKTARIWTADGVPQAVIGGYHDELLDVALCPDDDGTLVAAASADGTAGISDAATGRRLLTLRAHSGTVFTAQFAPGGSSVVTASADTRARIWRVAPRMTFRGHEKAVNSAKFNDNGDRVVTASDDYSVRVWDVESGKERWALWVHQGPVNDACFSPNGEHVATAGLDGVAYLWDFDSDDPPTRFRPHIDQEPYQARAASLVPSTQSYDYGIISVDFNEKGDTLLLATTQEVLVWPVTDSKPKHRFPLVEQDGDHNPFEVASGATFSPKDEYILTAQLDKTARLRYADGRVKKVLGEDEKSPYPDAVYSAVFNKDGDRVVVANGDGTARVFDLEGNLECRLVGLWGQLRSAAFSGKDPNLVAGGDATGRLHVWNKESGQLVMITRAHAAKINGLVFSPDGGSILTASDDHAVKLHPVEPIGSFRELLDVAGERLGSPATEPDAASTKGA